MKKIRTFLLALVIIAAVCGCFYAVNEKSKKDSQKEELLTEVQKLTTKDLTKNYPETPREVIKLYNRILACYYDDTTTDDEVTKLAAQVILMFDDQLASINDEETYTESIKNDIADFKENNKTLVRTSISDSNDVLYLTDKDDEIAYVTSSYFVKANKSYTKTYQQYVLRKDSDGEWKILTFYTIEPESTEE